MNEKKIEKSGMKKITGPGIRPTSSSGQIRNRFSGSLASRSALPRTPPGLGCWTAWKGNEHDVGHSSLGQLKSNASGIRTQVSGMQSGIMTTVQMSK